MAAASKAAYAAAAAAYGTVMATLGLDSAGSNHAASKMAAVATAADLSTSLFSKYFGSSAGSSVIPVYDAQIHSMPGLSSLSFGAAAGSKGTVKPPSVKREQPVKQGVPADQVKSSVWLCTLVQILGMLLISGTMHALSVLPMLGWMWLLMEWGYNAFAVLPLLSFGSLVLGVGLTIVGKWVLVGRYKEGEYPIWGWQYIKHWLSNQFVVVSAGGWWGAWMLLPWKGGVGASAACSCPQQHCACTWQCQPTTQGTRLHGFDSRFADCELNATGTPSFTLLI
jgi:hypothetical protein